MSDMIRNAAAALALIGALTTGGAIAEGIGPVAFVGVNLIPMDRERVLENVTVLVDDGRVRAIAPAGYIELPPDAAIVEAPGHFLMPGLAEMHAHVPGRRGGDQWQEDVLLLYVANGVTTARGMLGEPDHLELRAKIARHEVLGPRLFTSGPSLNGNSVDGPDEARRLVREQAAAGYDFLKLHPGLTRAEFDAIAATADESGIAFAGHVSTDVGLDRALAASQASIDHLDGYLDALVPESATMPASRGFFGAALIDLVDAREIDAIARATQAAGVWVVPTETLMENIVLPTPPETLAARPGMRYVPPATLARWVETKRKVLADPDYDPAAAKRFIALRKSLIRALNDAGAGILLGSDAPQVFNVPGFAIHYELEAMVAAGLTPYEALRTGTANPAYFFGLTERFGEIAIGRDADLILVENNPLEDVGALRRPLGVMVRGRWLPRSELNTRLEEVAARYAD